MSATAEPRKRSRRGAVRSIGGYLRVIASRHFRGRIRHGFRGRCTAAGLGWPQGPLDDRHREYLRDAVFQIEDELESRHGGQPDLPVVVQMRRARCRLESDLGWSPPDAAAADAYEEPAAPCDRRTPDSTGGASGE